MKTRLIWHKCKLNDDKDSFWIECTDDEVIKSIMPFVNVNNVGIVQEVEQNRGHSKINTNENERIFCNFFLISTDYKCIKSYRWVMPYSGMWNGYSPFEEIEVVDFNSLEDLKGIYGKILSNKN